MIVNDVLKTKSSNEMATITADRTLMDAVAMLHEWRIGALIVVGPAGRLQGIISERDIVRGLATKGVGIMSDTVATVMTGKVVTCRPEDSLNSLMESMTRNRIRHLPVIDEKTNLVGIMTIGDVVKARLDEVTVEIDQMREYVMTAH
jgi:CBS domain-containing protein